MKYDEKEKLLDQKNLYDVISNDESNELKKDFSMDTINQDSMKSYIQTDEFWIRCFVKTQFECYDLMG